MSFCHKAHAMHRVSVPFHTAAATGLPLRRQTSSTCMLHCDLRSTLIPVQAAMHAAAFSSPIYHYIQDRFASPFVDRALYLGSVFFQSPSAEILDSVYFPVSGLGRFCTALTSTLSRSIDRPGCCQLSAPPIHIARPRSGLCRFSNVRTLRFFSESFFPLRTLSFLHCLDTVAFDAACSAPTFT